MNEKEFKQEKMIQPIENHSTAAWSNTKIQKKVSKVSIPDEVSVRNAKEYVDTNEK